jgi:hypothetical protein
MRARKPKQIKHDPLKNPNYYGVFNHMIEDNITYLTGCNSFKSRVISWLMYAVIIFSLAYLFFSL